MTRGTSWGGDRVSAPRSAREAVHRRDKVCTRCGSEDQLEVDHVAPVTEARLAGWTDAEIDALSNLTLLCRACHATKTAEERARGLARRKARITPEKPRHPGLLP